MPSIFVTGGTGFIGQHVVRALSALGTHDVHVLSRANHAAVGNVSYRRGDLGDVPALTEAIGAADVVIHLAGCKKKTGDFQATNVVGTRNILAACERAGAGRLVYLSSVGVTGPTAERVVTEDTRCAPANAYEQSKHEAEMSVRRWAEARPGTTTILRPTNVFGEDDPEHHLLNLMGKLKARRFYFVGQDTSRFYVNYLYVKEISELVVSLMSLRSDGLFIVNTPTPLGEFVMTLKRLLGDTSRIAHLPYWPVKAAALCGDRIPKRWMAHPPVTSLKLAELTSEKQYSSASLKNALSWTPAFSTEVALRNLLLHYREKGLLT